MNTTTNTRGVEIPGLIEMSDLLRKRGVETRSYRDHEIAEAAFRAALEAALSAPEPAAQGEAVAVIGADFTIHWVGTGPIAPIIEKHGLKVGDKLYATTAAERQSLNEHSGNSGQLAEPAAQGEGEAVADECRHDWVDYVQAEYKPRHRVLELGESNIERYVRIGLMCTICGAEKPAPPAQPAERVPEGWRVLQIGAVGSAYDPPNTHRAFTYDWQPGNGGAWALGMASSTAAKTSAGDYIDDGLNLLKALQEQGFGVFQIEPASPAPSEGGKGVGARCYRTPEAARFQAQFDDGDEE